MKDQQNLTNPAESIKTVQKPLIFSDPTANGLGVPLVSIPGENYIKWNSFSISNTPSGGFLAEQPFQMPGLSNIKISFTNDIEKKHEANYDYSKVKFKGANSKIITTTTQMSADDYKIFITEIFPMLHVSSFDKDDDGVLYISNELLKLNNIYSVMLDSIEQKTPEIGIFVIEMSFTEYKKPQKRTANKFPTEDINASPGGLTPPNAALPGQGT